jgi:hypothetical protein
MTPHIRGARNIDGDCWSISWRAADLRAPPTSPMECGAKLMKIMRNLTAALVPITFAAASALTGCASPTATGAGVGATGGALIGSATGNAGKGALIGAGAGALGGYLYDQNNQRNDNRRYNRTYDNGRGYGYNPDGYDSY